MHRRMMFSAAAIMFLFASLAEAAIILEAGQPSYVLDPSGLTTTTVSLFLSQTNDTVTLSSEGGINQFELQVQPTAPLAGLRPELTAITPNPDFTGNKLIDLSTGQMGGAFLNLESGVLASQGRVYLGDFQFRFVAGAVNTTYQITAPQTEGYIWTASGTDITSQVQAGSFLVAVPEPASLSLLAVGATVMFWRRRCRATPPRWPMSAS